MKTNEWKSTGQTIEISKFADFKLNSEELFNRLEYKVEIQDNGRAEVFYRLKPEKEP